MTDRRNGFTLVELIVVISIVMVLAAMVIPGLMQGPYLAKKAATQSEISSMELALAQYELDYGAYPEDEDDYSSKKLVEALKGDRSADPPRKTYFPFKPKQIIDGEYYSALNQPFYYEENASVTTKDETTMKNLDTFDIWTSDGKKTKDGKNKNGPNINNWD